MTEEQLEHIKDRYKQIIEYCIHSSKLVDCIKEGKTYEGITAFSDEMLSIFMAKYEIPEHLKDIKIAMEYPVSEEEAFDINH